MFLSAALSQRREPLNCAAFRCELLGYRMLKVGLVLDKPKQFIARLHGLLEGAFIPVLEYRESPRNLLAAGKLQSCLP